jgi:hypothetical protein
LVEDVSVAQPHGFTEDSHLINTKPHTIGTESHTPGSHSTGHGSHTTGSHAQPSMGDKLNPKIDADRDGKAGIMD